MPEKPEHIRYIRQSLDTGISRETLQQIYAICADRKKCCLVGFNDYSKHLVNLLPGVIEAIVDDDPSVNGIFFRGKQVIHSSDTVESKVMVFCKFEYISEYTAKLKFSDDKKIIAVPGAFGKDGTRFADPYRHDQLHRKVFQDWENVPNSMMARDKIMYLVELFKSCSNLNGKVAEFGVWQGGSAVALMRAARYLGVKKKFLLFDLFESLEPKFKEAIMCNDEIKRKLSVEGDFLLIEGDMNEKITEFEKEEFCFVHYDLGYHPRTLRYLLDKTVEGGVVVFDNYGFATASPALYQRFFKDFGQFVMSVPFSEQGVLIKRPMDTRTEKTLKNMVKSDLAQARQEVTSQEKHG